LFFWVEIAASQKIEPSAREVADDKRGCKQEDLSFCYWRDCHQYDEQPRRALIHALKQAKRDRRVHTQSQFYLH
jgi:hypothetical protein